MHFKLSKSGHSKVRLTVVLAYIFVVDGTLVGITDTVGNSLLGVSVLDLDGGRLGLKYTGSCVVVV